MTTQTEGAKAVKAPASDLDAAVGHLEKRLTQPGAFRLDDEQRLRTVLDALVRLQRSRIRYAKAYAQSVRDHLATSAALSSQSQAAEGMAKALEPFSDVLVDVGDDEADSDSFQPIHNRKYAQGPQVLVGHLRAACAALSQYRKTGVQ